MSPAPLAAARLLALALLAAACADAHKDAAVKTDFHSGRGARAHGTSGLPLGCLYEGRWFAEGAGVATREACLRCACYRGALACRRRACAPLPDPPPKRCHVLHRKATCCPELHCPEGVTVMEHGATARFENDQSDIATPASIAHACVEGGTVYAAGSAMSSSVACEQCFCLGAARRCVRPRCLPPPPGCRPTPAPGACCPQRYYCEHTSTQPPDQKHTHECEVNGHWVSEGERVVTPDYGGNCTQCFCLRGAVRCQPLACAPPLLGCKPLLRPGECCAHQYHCDHKQSVHAHQTLSILNNALAYTRNEDRAFHTSKSSEHESTTKNVLTSKSKPTTSISNNHLIATTKVKRKTNDPPPSSSQTPKNASVTTGEPIATNVDVSTQETKTEVVTEKINDQPEGIVKIMINGTINCTTELSSTSLPLNMTVNDIDKIKMDVQPRVPLIDTSNLEANTFSPNDIITDRNVNGFDENDSFIINVTSSLITNTSHSTKSPTLTVSKISVPTAVIDAQNSSKKTKGDYDYDYTEPTLPPSLPNLKIIPFVAADAVLDDEPLKEPLTYPILEREDKFPVYYPSIGTEDTAYATKRADIYNPTQYPIFITDKNPQYPSLTHELDLTDTAYDKNRNDLEYTVSTSLGNQVHDVKKAMTKKSESSTFGVQTPTVNLFSPPVETEGGFMPKDPGSIDDYYSVYSSTPSESSLPHLTTSMQLDVTKSECLSSDGRHVAEGGSMIVACSECTCAWGDLHCSPRPCHTPIGCRRRPAGSNSADTICCGELICDADNNQTTLSAPVTAENKTAIETKYKLENKTVTAVQMEYHRTDKNITKPKEDTKIINSTFSQLNNSTLVSLDTTIQAFTKVVPSSTTTTEKITTESISITTVATDEETSESSNNSQEYEDDDDDEGFSFGSVLKLLLSDNYETTTAGNLRTSASTAKSPARGTNKTPIQPSVSTLTPFIPLPPRPYIPANKVPTTVNRIDHLVLGEATAIRTSTRPPITYKPSSKPTTQRVATKLPELTNKVEQTVQYTSETHEGPRPPSLGGIGAGLLKLAGCNIYGRMYRVGRIIAELSTPCQECWCTEFGVQCKPLTC